MPTLQIPLSEDLTKGLNRKTKPIGISHTAYVKMLIAKDVGLLDNETQQNNVFDADRDNKGFGIPADQFKAMLKNPDEYDWEKASWIQK